MFKNRLKLLFVYLGASIPEYVIENASRTAELFNFETYLAIETKAKLTKALDRSSKLQIIEFDRSQYGTQPILMHDAKFRDGFWIHTFDRLLVMKHIHILLGQNTSLLHIESDMLLMPSFPFDEVLGGKVKWFQNNLHGDVASLVFLPSFSETNWLHDKLIEEAQSDPLVTDMSALRRIRSKFPERIETFPDIFSVEEEEKTQHIFDGSALGMWISGVDPRNTYGFHFLHMHNDFQSQRFLSLEEVLHNCSFFLDDAGNLFLSKFGHLHQIHCLHIHTKDMELFAKNNKKRLDKYIDHAINQELLMVKFDFTLFKQILIQNMKARTLVAYLKNMTKFFLKGVKEKQNPMWSVLVNFVRRSRL